MKLYINIATLAAFSIALATAQLQAAGADMIVYDNTWDMRLLATAGQPLDDEQVDAITTAISKANLQPNASASDRADFSADGKDTYKISPSILSLVRKKIGITKAIFKIAQEHDEFSLQLLQAMEPAASIDTANEFGQSALHLASQMCTPRRSEFGPSALADDRHGENGSQAAMFLLNHGASKNFCDKNGDTPLHYCAKFNNTETAELLICWEADVNALNTFGQPPLHYAYRASCNRFQHDSFYHVYQEHGIVDVIVNFGQADCLLVTDQALLARWGECANALLWP